MPMATWRVWKGRGGKERTTAGWNKREEEAYDIYQHQKINWLYKSKSNFRPIAN
jgi:hypothetical protein